jgi:hypothetical protein
MTSDLQVTVPAKTPHGTFMFQVAAGADGATIGAKAVTVTVTVLTASRRGSLRGDALTVPRVRHGAGG